MKGADQCPKCASRKWGDVEQPVTSFYAGVIRVCGNCGTAWEPFDPADMIDPDERCASFREPCGNCAFRPGSPEQANTVEWKKTIASLKAGGRFYCHKGVPITPNDGHGFAYPDHSKTRRNLRLCRGYLNMLPSIWKAREAIEMSPAVVDAGEPWVDEPWVDEVAG